jgi:hypothetical protein
MSRPQPAPSPTPGGGRLSERGTADRPSPEEWEDWPCYIISRVNGLNIRRRPSRNSPSEGSLDAGDDLPARCSAVEGDEYTSCGGSYWWIPVYYRRRRGYVAWACVDWYSNGGPGQGIRGDTEGSEEPRPTPR